MGPVCNCIQTILRSQSLNLHKRSDFKYKVLTLEPRILHVKADRFKDPHFTYCTIKNFNPIAGISHKFLHRLSTMHPGLETKGLPTSRGRKNMYLGRK